ncbi:snare associated Golgi protein-domain-containing protein [Gilbertella persicaria]|uniref:snare associated Golgi protein-domain-containing protein n=1 Tax=Gilbertella persicaria TaxID=101096 RepID=UPI002220010C|nr:snare associated Golgi protein-domain-containing protein [Gilbertella persicaria]KAI8069814.1 snare associated Golgi protein-domain-containing protein [Gilbertella persicaria]
MSPHISTDTADYFVGTENNALLDDFSELEDRIEGDDEVIYRTDKSASMPTWKQLVPRLLIFVLIGILSLVFSISLAHIVLDIGLPRTLEDVKATALHLDELLQNSWTGYGSVTFVFSVLYLWQQAFSIPGSVLLNLLAGYLYGIFTGAVLTSFLTASGATLAYALAMLVGKPLIRVPWFARKAEPLSRQLEQERRSGGLFWWLLFARLFPFSPYWFINLISPLLDIPVVPFFWSTVFGSMPYNFVCAQAGDVLSDLTSTSDIVTVSLVMKLLIVSFISLVPVIWGKSIQQWTRRIMGLPPIVDDKDVEKALNGQDDMELAVSHSDYNRVSHL